MNAFPQRAVVLIDTDQMTWYVWQTDDAFEKLDFFPVKVALGELATERDDFGADKIDLSVEYDDGAGQRYNIRYS